MQHTSLQLHINLQVAIKPQRFPDCLYAYNDTETRK